MRSIFEIETYAYVVFVVVSCTIVTRFTVPLALLRLMGMTTISCGDDVVDVTLAACRVLEAELDAGGGALVGGEVIVEDIVVVDAPRLDTITVSKLLVVEGSKDIDESTTDDIPICGLLVELEACSDDMPELAVEANITLEVYDVAEFVKDMEEMPVIVEDEVKDPGLKVAIKELEDKLFDIETNRAACTFEFGLIAPIEDFS